MDQQTYAFAPRTRPSLVTGHVPALDGLRGVAILLVLACHGPGWESTSSVRAATAFARSGGWIGVDVFFALSGYLITGILADARGSARYFRDFYIRRALRIWPLYYLLLAAVLVMAPALAGRPILGAALTPGQQALYWLGLPNWLPMLTTGSTVPGGDLCVAWSLAVEEQFYLIWPAVVAVLDRRTAVRLASAIAVFSVGARAAVAATSTPAAAYMLTPCKLDGLALGSIMALVQRGPGGIGFVRRLGRGTAIAGAILGAAAVIWAWSTVGSLAPTASPAHVVISSAAAMAGAGTISLCVAAPGGLLARGLSLSPLRWLGRYSYGLYLLHLPAYHAALYFAGEAKMPGWANVALYAMAGPAAAWVTWHLVERRALSLRPCPSRAAAREARSATTAFSVRWFSLPAHRSTWNHSHIVQATSGRENEVGHSF